MSSCPSIPEYLKSSHALIRALKAPTDPPRPDWPLKTSIAQEAWCSEDIYLPNKAIVLRDWVIDSWSKTRQKSSDSPLLNPTYHQVLALVAPSCPPLDSSSINLFRAFLQVVDKTGSSPDRLVSLACQSFRLLHHGQSNAVKADLWLDAYSSLVSTLAAEVLPLRDGHALSLWSLLAEVWLPEDSPETGRKLCDGLLALTPSYARAWSKYPSLRESDMLPQQMFSLSALEGANPFKQLLERLNSHTDQDVLAVTSVLPDLLKQYIAALQRNRYKLHLRPSKSEGSLDIAIAQHVRETVYQATVAVIDSLNIAQRLPSVSAVALSTVWDARVHLWTVISHWGGYIESEQHWARILSMESAAAQNCLQSVAEPIAAGHACRNRALQVLSLLEQLDHAHAGIQTGTIQWCIAAPPFSQEEAAKLLVTLIDYHRLTRDMPTLILQLDQCVQDLFVQAASSETVRSLYAVIIKGTFGSTLFRRALSTASKEMADQKSATKAWHEVSLALLTRFSVLHDEGQTWSTALADGDSKSTRKRKREASSVCVTRSAAIAGIRSRIARIVLTAGTTLKSDDLAKSVDNTTDVTSKLEQEAGDKEWEVNIICAARLRLSRCDRSAVRKLGVQSGGLLDRFASPSTLAETRNEILAACLQSISVAPDVWPSLSRERLVDSCLSVLSNASGEAIADNTTLPLLEMNQLLKILTRGGSSIACRFASKSQISRLLQAAAAEDLPQSSASDAAWTLDGNIWDKGLSVGMSVNVGLADTTVSPVDVWSDASYHKLHQCLPPTFLTSEQKLLAWSRLVASTGRKWNGTELEWMAQSLSDAQFATRMYQSLADQVRTRIVERLSLSCHEKTSAVGPCLRIVRALARALTGMPAMWNQLAMSVVTSTMAARARPGEPSWSFDLQSWVVIADRLCSTKNERLSAELEPLFRQSLLHWAGSLATLLKKPAGSQTPSHTIALLSIVPTMRKAGHCLSPPEPLQFLVDAISTCSVIPALGDADSTTSEITVSQSQRTHLGTSTSVTGSVDNKWAERLESCSAEGRYDHLRQLIEGFCRTVVKDVDALPLDLTWFSSFCSGNITGWPIDLQSVSIELLRQWSETRSRLLHRSTILAIFDTASEVLVRYIRNPPSTGLAALFTSVLELSIHLLRTHREIFLGYEPKVTSLCVTAYRLFAPAKATLSPALDPQDASLLSRLVTAFVNSDRLKGKKRFAGSGDHSLGGMSKHVTAILLAYTRALANAEAPMSAAVNAELRRALYPLCERLTEGGRVHARGREGEGLGEPLGLGEGPRGEAERAVWISLWQDWSRKKYAGQG